MTQRQHDLQGQDTWYDEVNSTPYDDIIKGLIELDAKPVNVTFKASLDIWFKLMGHPQMNDLSKQADRKNKLKIIDKIQKAEIIPETSGRLQLEMNDEVFIFNNKKNDTENDVEVEASPSTVEVPTAETVE